MFSRPSVESLEACCLGYADFILSVIIGLFLVHFSLLVMGCYEYQSCLTPRNRLGNYVTRAVYLQMAKESQDFCLGVCIYNKTTQLICCAYQDVSADKRISQIQCEIDHTRHQLIVHGKLAKIKEFSFMGDSGGPIIMYRNINEDYFYEMPFIIGITSFDNDCGGGVLGVYTRVVSYIDWIEKIVIG